MTYGGRGIYLVGERDDAAEAEGPWSDVGWGWEIVFEVDSSGDTASAGPRHIQLTSVGEGESAIGTVHLGDSSDAEGISVASPTDVDHLAVPIGVDERWGARFDTRSGSLRGKLWRITDGEPAAWSVEVAMAETEDAADLFTLWIRCGNPASEQTVRIHSIDYHDGAHDGMRVEHEWLGYADGVETTFKPSHRYVIGTLVADINGVDVAPTVEDGTSFTLDYYPTAGSAVRASYIVGTED